MTSWVGGFQNPGVCLQAFPSFLPHPLPAYSRHFSRGLCSETARKRLLRRLNHSHHPLLYRRYVDDTFCVFHNEQDAMSFFDYINSRHPNIKFTFEKENDGKLSFLDILVDNSSRDCVFSVFHKKKLTLVS